MKKLTVGLFTDAFYPMIDGVGMVVHNHALNLSKYCNVYVIAPDYKEEYDDSKYPYKVIRIKSWKVPIIDYSVAFPKMSKDFFKTLDEIHFDIIHIHSPFPVGASGVDYAIKRHIPLFGTMHSQYKSDFKRAVHINFLVNKLTNSIIKVYDKCNLCYAVNYATGEIFYKDYGYKMMPKILNNATEMAPLEEKDDSIDKQYQLDNDTKVFLFVGRINRLKNIFFIVDSLKELNKMTDKKYKMLFVGDGQDKEEFVKYINQNNMNKNIIMCGKIKNRDLLRKYYARADLFLFPSMYDASSIVQIEAASQKLPVLFLKGSATSYQIQDNVNGYLSENDPIEYAKKIKDIMDNEELHKKVREKAYIDLYKTWEDIVGELYKDYKNYIKE